MPPPPCSRGARCEEHYRCAKLTPADMAVLAVVFGFGADVAGFGAFVERMDGVR